MYVKPLQEGMVVRHPHTFRPLDPQGEEVQESRYWLRRLLHGDVIAAEPPEVSKVQGKKSEDKQK